MSSATFAIQFFNMSFFSCFLSIPPTTYVHWKRSKTTSTTLHSKLLSCACSNRAKAFPSTFSSTLLLSFEEERLQTVISENDDTLSIIKTLHQQSYAPNDNTDMDVDRVQYSDENRLNVSFRYDVPGTEPALATFRESANPYLPWYSCMALSHS